MKRIHLLPFDVNTVTHCYPYISFPYSIIHDNMDLNFEKWQCGKYINCYFKESSQAHKFIISVHDNWSTDKKILKNQVISFSKETFKAFQYNIPLIIKKALLSGAYPYIECSQKYIISNNNDESEESFIHCLINGYDDIRKVYYVNFINPDNELESCEVEYERFETALFNNSKRGIHINLWKYNPEAEIVLDLNEIKNDLEDYFHSKNSKPQYNKDRSFGLQAIADLKSYFLTEAQKRNLLDIKYLRGFLEHKIFMAERMKYLCSENIIDSDILSHVINVHSLAEKIYKLGIEYNETLETDKVDELLHLIDDTVNIEKSYISIVINNINEKLKYKPII